MKIMLSNREKEAMSKLKKELKNTNGDLNITPISKSVKGISESENEINFSEELVCDFLKLVQEIGAGFLSLLPMIKLVFKDIIKKGKEFEKKWDAEETTNEK